MNEETRDIAIQNIRALIGAFSSRLPAENLRDARDLLDHGEWGEALDVICTQLYEYEVPVSSEHYKLIEQAGRLMGMQPSEWNYVSELVENVKDPD